ncbi:MAG: baseplate J/gp47 family protein [Pseudomonadota bacterium]
MLKLPPISKSIDEVRSLLFGFIDAAQDALATQGFLPTRLNLNKGIVRGFIELFAWGQWQLYNFLERLLSQAAPYHATGEWLDLHAGGVNLSRRKATKATGIVRCYRAEGGTAGNINIPKDRIFRTKPDGTGEMYRYSNPASVVLLAGTDFVDVPVVAESYGASSNVSTGQICELITPVAGIGEVLNPLAWLTSEGANEETDAQLAHRYSLVWKANNGCTKYAYESWALSVEGVTSVSILDKHPRGQGTVDIVVRGSDFLPTESLLEKVREAIAPHVPINDDWLVKSPVAVPVTLYVQITYIFGNADTIQRQVEEQIYALFAETSPLSDITALQIGHDVPLSLLTHTVMAVVGVKTVQWVEPACDVCIAHDSVAQLASLVIVTSQASEM